MTITEVFGTQFSAIFSSNYTNHVYITPVTEVSFQSKGSTDLSVIIRLLHHHSKDVCKILPTVMRL